MSPPAPCALCPQHDHAPRIPEEAEAWRILWPVPPLRVGPGGPIGIDAGEVRARINPAFDPDLVLALCLAAEGEAMTAFSPKRGD